VKYKNYEDNKGKGVQELWQTKTKLN
jgi:hypothetical protein